MRSFVIFVARCIDKRFRCDGRSGDCSDNSDEKGCPNKCDPDEEVRFYNKI
jgi:hypothetical protein